MTTDTETILVERELWTPGRFWDSAVEAVAQRFARVREFTRPAGNFVPHERVARDMQALLGWAGDDIDVRRELARYFDEHLAIHVRPDRAVNATLRERSAAGEQLTFASALPEAALRSLLLHLGTLRLAHTVFPEVVEASQSVSGTDAGSGSEGAYSGT